MGLDRRSVSRSDTAVAWTFSRQDAGPSRRGHRRCRNDDGDQTDRISVCARRFPPFGRRVRATTLDRRVHGARYTTTWFDGAGDGRAQPQQRRHNLADQESLCTASASSDGGGDAKKGGGNLRGGGGYGGGGGTQAGLRHIGQFFWRSNQTPIHLV